MSSILHCRYIECYHNDNLQSACLAEKITVDATGICENLLHCDEFQCNECDRFDVCAKDKKNQYLDDA